jgi:hypothetical protein
MDGPGIRKKNASTELFEDNLLEISHLDNCLRINVKTIVTFLVTVDGILDWQLDLLDQLLQHVVTLYSSL